MASETEKRDDPGMEQCYENLIVIDIGANLTNKKYSRDLDSVVQRAKDAGTYLRRLIGSKNREIDDLRS